MYYLYYADAGLIKSGANNRDFIYFSFAFGNLLFNCLTRRTMLNSELISFYRHKTCI